MEQEIPAAKIYWMQIIISILFGVFAYYSLDLGLIDRGTFDSGLVLLLHLAVDILVPLLYLRFLIKQDFRSSLRASTRNIGTNVLLVIVICGFVFFINI